LRAESADFGKEPILLGALAAGEHLLAIEVKLRPTPGVPVAFAGSQFSGGELGCFARFDLQNRESMRVLSGPQWKTSLAEAPDWFGKAYDDPAWEPVRATLQEGPLPWEVSPAFHLRREFTLAGPLVKARLYATALGAYEAHLN